MSGMRQNKPGFSQNNCKTFFAVQKRHIVCFYPQTSPRSFLLSSLKQMEKKVNICTVCTMTETLRFKCLVVLSHTHVCVQKSFQLRTGLLQIQVKIQCSARSVESGTTKFVHNQADC